MGIAIRENLVDPSYMSSATVTRLSNPSYETRPISAETAKATAIGTFRQIIAIKGDKDKKNNHRSTRPPHSPFQARFDFFFDFRVLDRMPAVRGHARQYSGRLSSWQMMNKAAPIGMTDWVN